MAPYQQSPAGDWDEYRRMILAALDRLERSVGELRDEVRVLQGDVTALKVKAALIGALAGLVAGAIIGKLVH